MTKPLNPDIKALNAMHRALEEQEEKTDNPNMILANIKYFYDYYTANPPK